MAWKEVTIEELAKSLGANVAEVREKQRLVKLIVKTRKDKDLDVLFNMLVALGLDYKVVTRKAA